MLSGAEITGMIAASAVSANPYNVLVRVTDALGLTAQVRFVVNVLTYTVNFRFPDVVAGYLKGANGRPVDLPEPAVAYADVSDVSRLPFITFAVSGQADEISLGQVHRSRILPTISVQVNGRSRSIRRGGDVTLKAVDSLIITKASVPVVVVVPAGIGKHPPTVDEIVDAVRLAVNTSTSPAAFDVPATKARLITGYFVNQEVQVVDQFRNDLSDIYVGTAVSEYNKKPINVQIQAGGTYSDPVGDFVAHYTLAMGVPSYFAPVDLTTAAGRAAKEAWTGPFTDAQPLLVPYSTPLPIQPIPVQVGGHQLAGGVKNRKVTVTLGVGLTARVKIDWPDPPPPPQP
jgi:hypothetical protein